MELFPGAVENVNFISHLQSQHLAQVSCFVRRERHAIEVYSERARRRVESAAGHRSSEFTLDRIDRMNKIAEGKFNEKKRWLKAP
jgi:hypothetical protein